MSLVAEKVAVAVLIHHLVYCSARCKANPLTQTFAAVLDAGLAGLLAAMEARNTAANQTIMTGALRDFATEGLTDLLVPMGQRLAAAYGGSRTSEGYLRVFEKSPSLLTATAHKVQLRVFGDLLKALQDPETPKALADDVKQFAIAFGLLETAIANDNAADAQFGTAVVGIAKARKVGLDALASVDGDLQKTFPRQRKIIARFTPATVKKVPKPTPAPAELELKPGTDMADVDEEATKPPRKK